MKFYLEDDQYCKMKLILSYFGEKDAKNCGQCSVCEKINSHFREKYFPEIINF
jgi:ATP-dependent DNA helicase RecQ